MHFRATSVVVTPLSLRWLPTGGVAFQADGTMAAKIHDYLCSDPEQTKMIPSMGIPDAIPRLGRVQCYLEDGRRGRRSCSDAIAPRLEEGASREFAVWSDSRASVVELSLSGSNRHISVSSYQVE